MKVFKNFLKLIIALITVAILFSFAIVSYGTITRPVEYTDYIEESAEKYNVDPLLILSVIRVESDFKPEAKSHMNAIGLMQLVPETAEWISTKLGTEFDESMLKDPKQNIELGTYYLSYLINHFGDIDLAVVAYNGGMGNVQKWIDEDIIGPNGRGLENIPINEARNYVIKVDENYEIYKKYYGTVELNDNLHKNPKSWLRNFIIEVEEIVRNF